MPLILRDWVTTRSQDTTRRAGASSQASCRVRSRSLEQFERPSACREVSRFCGGGIRSRFAEEPFARHRWNALRNTAMDAAAELHPTHSAELPNALEYALARLAWSL